MTRTWFVLVYFPDLPANLGAWSRHRGLASASRAADRSSGARSHKRF